MIADSFKAGEIVNYGYDISARLAMPQIILGYFFIGYAALIAMALYAMFMHRLLAAGWYDHVDLDVCTQTDIIQATI